MNREYGGVIWTKHALERLRERGISQSDAWATWRNPDQSRYAKSKEAWIYYKNYGGQRIEVVAKKNDKGEWLILSVWSKSGYGKNTTKNKSLLQLIWGVIKGK
ncbi:DUF4258 domain-containing protein [Candidatus Microgenomates bacterium]|nr:MAG: DUF4258 domain-containing protein [Candidatus Microgenomates bacterium]